MFTNRQFIQRIAILLITFVLHNSKQKAEREIINSSQQMPKYISCMTTLCVNTSKSF